MKTQRHVVLLIAMLGLSLSACGTLSQLSEQLSAAVGDWNISGLVGATSAAAASTSKAATDNAEEAATSCEADQVIATDSQANTTTAAVGEDCTFTLAVPSGESYVVSFSRGGSFVGTLVFDSGIDGMTTSTLPLVTGSGDLELGTITLQGDVATPSREPLETIDQDEDGVVDAEDPDDDGDNVPDDEEMDCDLDGIMDDHEGTTAGSCQSDREAWIVRIKPRHEQENVSVYRTVRAMASCRIDPDTVDPDTFRVFADDHEVECEYSMGHWRRRRHRHRGHHQEISNHARPLHIVKCKHFEDPFETDTLYTVELDGLECLDGTLVEPASIHFVTRPERDDDDYEDELEYDEYEDGEEPEDVELEDDYEDEDEDSEFEDEDYGDELEDDEGEDEELDDLEDDVGLDDEEEFDVEDDELDEEEDF